MNVLYQVPYVRIKQILLLRANRNYEKTAFAAQVAGGAFGIPGGQLLILKNHKVDTVVVDYENERNGRMGLVVQMERGKGQELGAGLAKHGITVVDPPEETPKDKKGKK